MIWVAYGFPVINQSQTKINDIFCYEKLSFQKRRGSILQSISEIIIRKNQIIFNLFLIGSNISWLECEYVFPLSNGARRHIHKADKIYDGFSVELH
jgi:hypothetical protein